MCAHQLCSRTGHLSGVLMNMTPPCQGSEVQPSWEAGSLPPSSETQTSPLSQWSPLPKKCSFQQSWGAELRGPGTEALGVALGQQRTALGHNSPHRCPRALSQTSHKHLDDTWQKQKRRQQGLPRLQVLRCHLQKPGGSQPVLAPEK